MTCTPKTIFNLVSGLIFSLSVFPLSVFAEIDELKEVESLDTAGEIEEWRFQDSEIKIPDYPETSSLLKLDIDTPDSPFEYFLDSKSLSVGLNGAVLYTIVIQSGSGGRNVLVEAVRCDTRQYKSYAYGISKKTFYKIPSSRWKEVGERGSAGVNYRHELVAIYFCSETGLALDKTDILNRVQNSENYSVDTLF